LTRFLPLLTTHIPTSNYFTVKWGILHTVDIFSTTYQPRLINIVKEGHLSNIFLDCYSG
jgi:hypothetical protein